ncbi:hypothetical protein NMY22_g84 [Coprinellus aureogranulatus]|nr:hypothetical protein NMY22_g84 [Coprinellus aureogranulatus]
MSQLDNAYYSGGGGYMAGGSPFSGAGSPGGGQRSEIKHSVRPMTIAQLNKASQAHTEAEWRIDDVEIGQVTLVAQVLSIQLQATNCVYTLHDGTGQFEARQWVDEESPLNARNWAGLKEDMYVRVTGGLKAFGNRRYINTQHIRPVNDPHEPFFHTLESITVTLTLERGPPNASGQTQPRAAASKDVVMGDASAYAAPTTSMQSDAYAHLPKLQQAIVRFMAEQPPSSEGIHVFAIARAVGSGGSDAQKIRHVSLFLCWQQCTPWSTRANDPTSRRVRDLFFQTLGLIDCSPPHSTAAILQQIATIHLQGDLIFDQPVGKHIRRVTIAQLKHAPDMGPPHHRLNIGGRECKYVELVANVPIVAHFNTGIGFTLDDGFGRLPAWFQRDHAEKPKQRACIDSLRPFDYAHIEGKVHRPPGSSEPIFQIISLRRVISPYEIFLHLLQALSEINETIKALDGNEVPASASVLLAASPARDRRVAPLQRQTGEIRPEAGSQERTGGRPGSKGKVRVGLPNVENPSQQIATSGLPLKTPTRRRYSPPKGVANKTPAALRRHPQYLGAKVLRYFRHKYSLATSGEGIAIDDDILHYLMVELEIVDLTTDDLKEALDSLVDQNYIYQTTDIYHYALVTQ